MDTKTIEHYLRGGLVYPFATMATRSTTENDDAAVASIRRHVSHALLTLAFVAVITVLLSVFVQLVPIDRVSMAYLIPVLFAATRWGFSFGLIAAIVGIGAADYFFYPPLYSFGIHNPSDVIELVLFAFVALITSHLAANVRRQAEQSRQREIDFHDLYNFSRKLAATYAPSAIYSAIQDYLLKVLGRQAFIFGINESEFADKSWAEPNVPEKVRFALRAIRLAKEPKAEMVVDDDANGMWLVRWVSPKSSDFGVIAVYLGLGFGQATQLAKDRVETILTDATATLERLDLATAIGEAKVRADADVFRQALVGSVSHELRTPLASILGAATVLGEMPTIVQDEKIKALSNVIREEADRLNREIQSLLDATRIVGQHVRPHRDMTDPTDVINAALDGGMKRLAGHEIELYVAEDIPLINIDSTLVEQALVQVLDNAAKYSAPDSAIKISASADDTKVTISVCDQGAGLTPEEHDQLYERAYRGRRHLSSIPGSGLGLWIAQAFVAANGGNLFAKSDGPGRGTTVSMTFPALRPTAEALNE